MLKGGSKEGTIKLGALNIAGIPTELKHLNKALEYQKFIEGHEFCTILETACKNKLPDIYD